MSTSAPSPSSLKHPSIRRLSQVFVELPASPYTRVPKHTPQSSPHVLNGIRSTNLKENARLQESTTFTHVDTTISTPFKRKLSTLDVAVAKRKRLDATPAYYAETQQITTATTMKASNPKSLNVSDNFPNGSFYCHQCCKKRDRSAGLRCTVRDTLFKNRVIPGRRCSVKYCRICLKRHYGQDMESIKAKGRTPSKKDKPHVEEESYIFKCPRCQGICSCFRCRKLKDLPSGNHTTTAQHTNRGPTLSNTTTVGVFGRHLPSASDGPFIQNISGTSSNTHATISTKALVKSNTTLCNPILKSWPKPKPKALHKPTWTSVHTTLDLSQAQDRFLIREFVLRFSTLPTSIGHTLLEELSELARGATDEEGPGEMWVSEVCVKAIVIWLLGLISDDEDGDREKRIKAAIKEIRVNGANLNKMWTTLDSLREAFKDFSSQSSPTDLALLTFPDPLPPPSSSTFYVTRSGRTNATGNVSVSAQMVPVLTALIEAAMRTELVRENIASAVKDGKDWVKEVREECKRENERWDVERKTLEGDAPEKRKEKEPEIEVKREAHKDMIQDLENALKVIMFTYAPRSGSLGRDTAGRTYWALSPGMSERDAALVSIISGKENAMRKRHITKGKRNPKDRQAMKDWAWFVAVWGKRPPLTETANVEKTKGDDDSDDSDEDDGDEDQWWGFWEPSEIRNLAGWITHQAGLQDRDERGSGSNLASSKSGDEIEHGADMCSVQGQPTKKELRLLVDSLDEQADFLEWRVKKQEEGY